MSSLAEINKTLQTQNGIVQEVVEEQSSTNTAIRGLVDKISGQMEADERQRLKDIADRRNQASKNKGGGNQSLARPQTLKEGFQQGMGLPGAGFFKNLFGGMGLGTGAGLALGAAGLAAAKSLRTAALGGLFAYLAPELSEKGGEMIVNLFKTVGIPMDWYDNLPPGVKDSIETGIGGIAGAIVAQIVLSFTARKGIGLLAGLSALVGKKVFDAIANYGAKPPKVPDLPPGYIDPGLKKAQQEAAEKAAREAAEQAARAAAKADALDAIRQADKGFKPIPPAPKVSVDAPKAPELPKVVDTGKGIRYTAPGSNTFMKSADAISQLSAAGYTPEGLPKVDTTTPKPKGSKFKNVDEAVEALEQSGKAAKYGRFLSFLKGLAKLMPAAAITLDFLEPAYAIYTDQPESVIKKELAGAFGSLSGGTAGAIAGAGLVTLIPGVGQTGIANLLGGVIGGVGGALAGEYTAEALASALMGGPRPMSMREAEEYVMGTPLMDMSGVAPTQIAKIRMEAQRAGPTSEEELRRQGSMTAMPGQTSATITRPGISENTIQLMKQDMANQAPSMSELQSYLDRVAAENRSGGGGNSTSTTNNSYLLDMGETVDIKDGGLALGTN